MNKGKTTSTGIEEKELVSLNIKIATKDLVKRVDAIIPEMDLHSKISLRGKIIRLIAEELAPHLSNKSELKKEAVEEAFGNGFQYQDTKYIRYDTAQRYTEKAIKEAIMRFVKWYNDIPDYAIDAKIDMEEVNKYLSSNEKEESKEE